MFFWPVLLPIVALLAADITVWDGVYTSGQAARGKAAYDAKCAACHREDLSGRNGRALVGDKFWADWSEDSLNSLFAIIRDTMPRGEPGSLPASTYADIVAYVLERNGFPAGDRELAPDSVQAVRVVRKSGPGPVPNFALVTTVGCLTEGARGVWTLRNSSEPMRTRNPHASTGDELARSTSMPVGAASFELMDTYAATNGHQGHRAEVKGLLIRGTPDRVNVTALQILAEHCNP